MMAESQNTRRTQTKGTPPTQRDAPQRGQAEQADMLAGLGGVGTGVVALGKRGPTRVEFSLVNGRAIFEGDIELGTPGELGADAQRLADAAGEMFAAVVADTSKRWPLGRIPYEPVPPSSPIEGLVTAAVQVLNSRTTVRFVPREVGDVDYVAFEVSAFCSSRVGRAGGRQVVRLTPLATVGNACHELCHVVGLWHEQSREDRDAFIRIRWENIAQGYDHNFRQQISDGDDVGPYDFGSIMHYPPDAFSRNGQPTIEAVAGNPVFGQRDDLSQGDIDAIRYLYGATSPVVSGTVVPAVGSGVQFRVTIAPGQVARVLTHGWPVESVVHWDVICTDGPAGAGPLITWEYAVGRSVGAGVDYFFTITNLVQQAVTAEARYVIIEGR